MKIAGIALVLLGLVDMGLWYLLGIDLYGELGIQLSGGIWEYSPFIATGAGWLLIKLDDSN